MGKSKAVMPVAVANKAVDFMYKTSPPDEHINIGFFGGEPMLEFGLIKEITAIIKLHQSYDASKTAFTLVSNGTMFNDEIASFMKEHEFSFCISSDGPPELQNMSRRFVDGSGSSAIVEQTIRKAAVSLPTVLINSVFTPETFRRMPEAVAYFSELGIKRIYFSPDYSAHWSTEDISAIPDVYNTLAEMYVGSYLDKTPLFINIIDNKIAAILRDGFRPEERCRMGIAEFAFAPSGNIYPCERLIGSDDGNAHCIGNLDIGINTGSTMCFTKNGSNTNNECLSCSINNYCMNWCGCSNSFATGYYNRVNSFICVSEQSAFKAAFSAFQEIEDKFEGVFLEHLSGRPFFNAVRD